jgi:hypothetical protein
MKQLRVYTDPDTGEPKVKCPRCFELIIPMDDGLLDGMNCEECGQTIDESVLRKYMKALEDFGLYN